MKKTKNILIFLGDLLSVYRRKTSNRSTNMPHTSKLENCSHKMSDIIELSKSIIHVLFNNNLFNIKCLLIYKYVSNKSH